MTAEAYQIPTPLTEAIEPDQVIQGETEGIVEVDDLPEFVEPALPFDRSERAPREIFPEWVRDRDTFVRAAKYELHYAAKWVAFHAVRMPTLYFLRLVLLAPRGTGKLIGGWMRWLTDADGRMLRQNMAGGPGIDPSLLYRLIDQRRKMLGTRMLISVIGGSVALSGIWSFITYTTAAGFTLAVVIVVVLLGFVGRSPEHRIVDGTGNWELPKLSMDLIVTALGSLGLSELNKWLKKETEGGGSAVRVRSPLGHSGPGWQVVLSLPPGVAAGQVVQRRDQLAAGLGRPVSAVWPSVDPDQAANELTLFVSEKPLSQQKSHPWPLEKNGQASVFDPLVIGVDPRGRPVTLTLAYTNGICGAIPRKGKSFSLRLIALGAALDPTCELHLFDLKGGADWIPLEKVAYRFRAGTSEEDLDYVLQDLRDLVADMERRYKVIKNLPKGVAPEGKTTSELASDRALGLWPVLLVLDETQVIFTDKQRKDEFKKLVTILVTRGPAAGIITYLATQRVSKETIPTIISACAIVRLCFKVHRYDDSNLVLGNLSGQGYNAATFGPKDNGIGYLVGEGTEPTVVRFPLIDGPAAEAIVSRARALRSRRGLLSGYCVEEDLEVEDDLITTPLQHLLDVWPGDRTQVTYAELSERLETSYPDVYANWGVEQVSTTMRAAGIQSIRVRRGSQVLRGVTLDALRQAVDPDDEPDVQRVEPTWPEKTEGI